ncbi:MAG: zinc ribbon domain-containing protein [Promethearchaeota archaeon]
MWGIALFNFVRSKTIIVKCSNCSTTIESEAQFCKSCGAKFEQKKPVVSSDGLIFNLTDPSHSIMKLANELI